MCHSHKLKCNRILGCCQCQGHDPCTPSITEWEKRAKDVFNCVADGSIAHNDMAKYQIYLQASIFTNRKPILGRSDTQDIMTRIKDGDHEVDSDVDDYTDPFYVPQILLDLCNSSSCYKVEWMNCGHYASECSDEYTLNIMSNEMCLGSAGKARVPPKVMDTCNLSDHKVAYKMWCDSIATPGKIISYTGGGYWKNIKSLVYTTVKIMTVVVNPFRFITVTSMHHSNIKTIN
jgi:hypothetical protein